MEQNESRNTAQSDFFRSEFDFEFEGYGSPIPWIDAIGISRVKKYGNGYASLFKIGLTRETSENADSLKKIWASISYGKDTPDGITVSSGNGWSDPIDLHYDKEFFFDSATGEIKRNGRTISPREVFETVEEAHRRPTRPIAGAYVRFKLLIWRTILPFVVRATDFFFSFCLYLVSGERVTGDVLDRLIRGIKDKPENTPLDTRVSAVATMDFFGYQAKRWSVVFFALLHLILFGYLYSRRPAVYAAVIGVLDNNVVAVCYVVVSFAITEMFIPGIFKFIITQMPKLYEKVVFSAIKV